MISSIYLLKIDLFSSLSFSISNPILSFKENLVNRKFFKREYNERCIKKAIIPINKANKQQEIIFVTVGDILYNHENIMHLTIPSIISMKEDKLLGKNMISPRIRVK